MTRHAGARPTLVTHCTEALLVQHSVSRCRHTHLPTEIHVLGRHAGTGLHLESESCKFFCLCIDLDLDPLAVAQQE
jgi:hypothetical protein